VSRIVVSQFVTLDGVFEDPGGSEGIERGGWAFRYERGEEGDRFKLDEVMAADGLLLGRVTYEGFAAAWPSRTDELGFADKFNTMPKYVVSSTLTDPEWNNTRVVTLDELPGLDGELLVNGSGQLVQALLERGLVDELRLMVFPAVLGNGRRLFGQTDAELPFRLVKSQPVGGDGVTILMQLAGLSASLGAFIAGALLAESSYRHQLEADIQPFEGLLLGLFFTAIGMTIDVRLLLDEPVIILTLVAGLVAVKAVILYVLGRWQGLEPGPARRLGIALSQGGEFAFVLFTVGYASGALTSENTELLTIIVTLSMAATPILLKIDSLLSRRRKGPAPTYDTPPDNDGHVIIAGFGRFGQIVARILTAKRIPFTALDISAEQVEFVRRFGAQAFYGDASRAEILEAADAHRARAFVLAIDDVEASMRTAELVRERYPDLPIFARARNRNHAHRLLDIGVTNLQRETFLSSLDIAKQLLRKLGMSEREAGRIIHTFRTHDERRLVEDYKLASDLDKLRERARSDVKTLEKLFEEDAAEEARLRELGQAEEAAR